MSALPYKKLPGRRRGFIKGASLWLASDHLLAVKSLRVREDYKRFYFRDVQALAVARAPRFHISTLHLLIVLLWLIAYAFARLVPVFSTVLWTLAALLVIPWIVVSASFSCRCRIYTAVSRDELPSIYRIWTARRFLAKITPYIAAVQGETPANWAEAAESARPSEVPASNAGPPPEIPRNPDAKVHTRVADLFVATLLLAGITGFFNLHWSQIVFTLLLLAESVALFVEHNRGRLKAPMQRLAIANLIAMGVLFYARQMIASFRAGISQQQGALRIPTFYNDSLTRGIESAICCLLALIGLAIIFQERKTGLHAGYIDKQSRER